MVGGGFPDPNYPKLPKSGSVGVLLTSTGRPPSKLPLRPLAPRTSMPPPAPIAADNKEDSSYGQSKNKGKVVDDSWSSNINSDDNSNTSVYAQGEVGATAVREQDRYMPIANVIRLMRKILPSHAKIADDAKETIQECVSEYISFITSEANERCRQEQRKTITAEDLLWSMSKLGFDDYVAPLNLYLQRYRNQMEGDSRGSLRSDPLHRIKRTVSDAGLYVQQQQPQYTSMVPVQGQYTNTVGPNIHHFPYIHQPQAFFSSAGGGSSTEGQGLLPPAALMPLHYYRMEAPAYRNMTLPMYRNVPMYREIMPVPTYSDGPIYRDVGGYEDIVGASSSSQVVGPSQQTLFPGLDPYTSYK